MTWSFNPLPREDILIEGSWDSGGSGTITSDWVDTSGVYDIRVSAKYNGSSGVVTVEEAQFDTDTSEPRVIRSQQLAASASRSYGEFKLSARFFRVVVSSINTNEYAYLTVRKVQ